MFVLICYRGPHELTDRSKAWIYEFIGLGRHSNMVGRRCRKGDNNDEGK